MPQPPGPVQVYEQLPVVLPVQTPVAAPLTTVGKLQLLIVVAAQPEAAQVLLDGVVQEPMLQV